MTPSSTAAGEQTSSGGSWPYIAPFATLIALLGLGGGIPGSAAWMYPMRTVAVCAVLIVVSRRLVRLRPSQALGSVLLGAAVFVIWIGPDLLWPGYRNHWLFRNSLLGAASSSGAVPSFLSVFFRVCGSALLVPIVEELFWRAWLMRWLIASDFQKVPLGTYAAPAFWISAVLFASEHGAFWEVGLLAGIAYNAWMIRTRSLADCMLAHAVTNACLAAYVLAAGKWEYWP